MKNHRVKDEFKKLKTHSHVAGLNDKILDIMKESFGKYRPFFHKGGLSDISKKIWKKEYTTPLKVDIEYLPAYCLV